MKNIEVLLILSKTGVDDILQLIAYPKTDEPVLESLFNRRFI